MKIADVLRTIPKRKQGDAVWLLSSLLGKSKSEIFLEVSFDLSSAQIKTWKSWWKRRERGEPLQYISGFAPFWGREFFVNKSVLIPRPETERLVEIALGLISSKQGARVLDIGTGSGAIAVTMVAERPDIHLLAADISTAALKMAKKNAENLGANLRLEKHDLFSKALQKERWDLVVSNPPYLDFRRDYIAADVKKWEPKLALEPGAAQKVRSVRERAAWCAEKILLACSQVKPAYTALELSPRIALFLERRWSKNVNVRKIWREADLAGRKRFLLIAWKDG